MADPGRLDELERKFDENPKRYFAPLANEYRKAGDPERAIELCRTYLPQQPSHMSGYIVYGQALHDAGKADESAAVFKQALTLDPENIIALRQLGDIARTGGDAAGAARWYGKVLELDPRNEEVLAYMGAATGPGTDTARPGPERPPPPAVRPEPEPDDSAIRLADIVSEPDAQQAPIAGRSEGEDDREYGDAVSAQAVSGADQPDAAGSWEWPPLDAAFDTTETVEFIEVESVEFAAEDPAETLAAPAASEPIEGPWHAAPAGGESEPPQGGREEHAAGGPLRFADFMPDEPAAFAPTPEELGETPAASAPGASSAPAAQPAPESVFVTETMAELYIQQGLPDEALGIYRELIERRDDPLLRKRMAEIEAGRRGAGAPRETVRDFFARIGARRPAERVELAVDRTSPLEALFGQSEPAAGDVGAAQRLAGAFGPPRSGNPRS